MRHLLLTIIISLAVAFEALAQDEISMPGNSLPALQAWLSQTMEKNGSHSLGSLESRLTNVRFDGCRLSFLSETTRTFDNSVRPNETGDLRTQGTRTYRPDSQSTMSYSFDLTEIDPSDIGERFAKGKMQTLLLNTIDRDTVVDYRLETSGFPTKSGSHKAVSITLRKKIIPEFKEKLITFIRTCQQKAPAGNSR